MFTVQNDWIQYETAPVRRTAVRGGAACAQRIPVRREVAQRPVVIAQDRAAQARPAPVARAVAPRRRSRLRLTRRGRFVLVVLPGLVAVSAALAAVAPLTAPAPAPASSPLPVAAAHG